MLVKNLIDEDFINYKKPSMFIIFPFCSFKCERESGVACCQNSSLAKSPNIYISTGDVIKRYIENPITKAIVCGGLEPFDSWNDLFELITLMREKTNDEFVIYTGYNEDEIADKIRVLSKIPNIIIKFGRFIPNGGEKFDEILGVKLQSTNQYAKEISDEV